MNPEYNIDDIAPLQELVRQNELFVLGPSNVRDVYDLTNYIFASNAFKRDLRALVDNNLLTRAIELASGAEVPNDPSKRRPYLLSAATMAFLIIGEFLIEPSLAIYEKASILGNEEAKKQLFLFRVADHIHPQQWLNLALQRIDRISETEIKYASDMVIKTQPEIEEENFEKTLDIWKLNYYFVLKAADIWKNSNDELSSALNFIKWMETDSFLNAVASVFNLVFFSPKRYSKMIKGINSESADKFKNGLKNAAWDLVYISHWGRNCKEANENTLWLLCSNDLALRGVACNIFEDPKMGENHLQHLLSYYWGAQKAATILDVYNKTFFSINSDPSLRDTVLKYRFSELDKSILSLERSVMTPIKTANYPAT
jgi:hypothetical protein